MSDFTIQAKENFQKNISDNPYPGRGLVQGMDQSGKYLIQVYWIMGRSENSRNRIFEVSGFDVRTKAADPSKCEDPSLIIYNAMTEYKGNIIMTNGDQTDTIKDALKKDKTFIDALNTREREPDAPNYTPRISGVISLNGDSPKATLSVLKASRLDPADTDRCYYFTDSFQPGLGRCVTTYTGDGNPLPSFTGEPYFVFLPDVDEIADMFWNGLNSDNKISLAVKSIDPNTGKSTIVLRNKYKINPVLPK